MIELFFWNLLVLMIGYVFVMIGLWIVLSLIGMLFINVFEYIHKKMWEDDDETKD